MCSVECKLKSIQRVQHGVRDIEGGDACEATSEIIDEESFLQAASAPAEADPSEQFLKHYRSSFHYLGHQNMRKLSDEKISFVMDKMEIHTKGTGVPRLILDFIHCDLPTQLTSNMRENGYLTPTPVQMQVIPTVLSGRDVLVSATTGSGKTAAFMLPILMRIYHVLGKIDFGPKVFLFYGCPKFKIATLDKI